MVCPDEADGLGLFAAVEEAERPPVLRQGLDPGFDAVALVVLQLVPSEIATGECGVFLSERPRTIM